MKKLLLCLAMVLPCFLLPAQEEQRDTTKVEDAILDVVATIEAGALEEASALLDSLSHKYPDNDAVSYYKGICSYGLRDYQTANSCFTRALELDPSNNWYRETVANLYLGSGEVERAETLLRELQASNPGKFPGFYVASLLAGGYRVKRDYDNYIRCLTELVRDEEADDLTKYDSLTRLLAGFDGRTFAALGPRLEEVMRAYTEAEPKSMDAHTLSMQVSGTLGNDARVIEECEKMMELRPDDRDNLINCLSIIADSYYSMKQERKAFKTYEKVLKIDPEDCHALNNYAYYLSLKKRRLAKAEKMSRITVTKEPDNPTYLDTFGWILYLRGKAKDAQPYFKHAMLYGGKDSAVVLMHYALVLEKLGEHDRATYYRTLAENKKQ